VSFAFYDQHLHDLNQDSTILDEVWRMRPNWIMQEIRDHLGRFLFSGDDVFKSISSLSGGEKARVALAKLFLRDVNLLFLDEPTNHLDLDARESLESAMREYPGTIVLVTHDRYLLDRVTDKIWAFENRHCIEYLGNYSDYKSAVESNSSSLKENTDKAENESRTQKGKKEQRLARMEIRKKTGKSSAYYEKEIERIEAEIAEVRDNLKSPEIAYLWTALDELTSKEHSLEKDLTRMLELWTKAAEAETDLDA